jgi:hypothetical protein
LSVEGHGIAVAPWRLAFTIIIIIYTLSPPLDLLSLFFHFTVTTFSYFNIIPPSTVSASASIEVLQG